VISDITGTRKELDKPVYEANKPIYGSDDDVDYDDYDEEDDYLDELDEDVDNFLDSDDDLDYDVDEHGEPKVTLPDNYDDDFDMNKVEEDDEDADDLLDNDHLINQSIKTYIQRKHNKGVNPTIKMVADLRICKNFSVGYMGVQERISKLGFDLDNRFGKATLPLGQKMITPSFTSA
jgi:hypothetical protein